MARRVGGGTRRATFEIKSEFFRKESTVLEKKANREERSLRPLPQRAPQSPVYICKKAAGNINKEKKNAKICLS